MANERTNEEWLRDLSGEPKAEALAALHDRLLQGLRYALKQRYRLTEPDLEDFVQEAIVKILDNLASFRGESKFTTWAQKIAIREAFTELRRKRWDNISLHDLVPERSDEDPATGSPLSWLPSLELTPERQVTQQSLRALLAHLILEELTDRQRTAMIAVVLHGIPLEEVARHMNSNRNALYKLLHDARQRIKHLLEARGLTVEEVMAVFASD